MRGFFLRIRILLAGLLLAACTMTDKPSGQDVVTVYLVRHAEKVLGVTNPPLTDAGQTRAVELALILSDTGISRIYSTDYLRTRQTAAPTAKELFLDVEIYDPKDLPGLADQLVQAGGIHLVVGHSNTTPELVEALGGDPGSAINEDSEYDRLYVVTINTEGQVKTDLRRYGKRYEPGRLR